MSRLYVGIDNGVTGAIGVVNADASFRAIHKMPTRKELNYTKEVRWITRVDVAGLERLLVGHTFEKYTKAEVSVVLERPMVNPQRFQATVSAVRALEATLIVLERLGWGYQYVDSRQWQSLMLPHGLRAEQLKAASLSIGMRLFPELTFSADADALLMAEWARRKGK